MKREAMTMPAKTKVSELIQHFNLQVVAGGDGSKRYITVPDLYRPGLEMAGYFAYYPVERVQILGRTELSFFDTLSETEQFERADQLFDEQTPCICISRGLDVPATFIKLAEERQIPILRSGVATTILASRITGFLENQLAPRTTVHGVLVDVYGVGVLITGSSGIGKSETALELVKRGHRLIADDAVEIRRTTDHILFGNAPDLIKHLLEIRGVGIINVMTLFGAGAVRNEKRVTVVVRLEIWQQEKQYDRLGIDEEKTQILDTSVPLVTIPVRPGRNLAVIIEVAAMNYRLKRMGYNAALQFSNKLMETMNEEAEDTD
jgi:HPr kinase/phosphorylase